MAKSIPWSVKGIGEDARKAARAAARAFGLTIGKWIDGAILQSAGLGARLRRLAVAIRRRTGSARPGVTVGFAFGTTALAALLLVTIVLRFGDLPVPAVSPTDAARERGAPPEPVPEQAKPETPPRPAATAEQAKPETPPRPAATAEQAKPDTPPRPAAAAEQAKPETPPRSAATAEQAKPETPPRLAATATETAPASSPPIPAIEKRVPTPGPFVALDTGWQPPSRRLDRAGIAEVQRMLAALRFTPGAANGVAGAGTVAAIRLYQQFAGIPVDGAATEALLRDLRRVTRTVATGSGAAAGR